VPFFLKKKAPIAKSQRHANCGTARLASVGNLCFEATLSKRVCWGPRRISTARSCRKVNVDPRSGRKLRPQCGRRNGGVL